MSERRGMQLVVACAMALSLALATTGAAPARPGPMRFSIHPTEFDGGEPTLAVLEDGSILAQAMEHTIKSTNGGVSWSDAHVPASQSVTLDPYIHADAETGRIIASQLLGLCQMTSISDDAGATWLDLPTQCPTVDHQKIGSGPWHDPSNKPYPREFYTCLNQVGQTVCATSLDGGMTWLPPVTVFPGFDPTADQGLDTPGFCGGLEGDPVSGPDGTIYEPREYCGRPFLGVSTDDGVTWTRHYVSPGSQTRPIGWGANNPSVTVDAAGTVYYAWTGDDWRHHISYSTDKGETWSEPVVVSDAGGSTTFPSIIAGRKGAVATAFVGTPDTDKGPDAAPPEAHWYLYVSYSFNADSPSAVWKTKRVSDNVVQIGCIGRHGGGCSVSGHSNLLDFNDTAWDPNGRLVIVYTDACTADCDSSATNNASMITVAVQTSGPSFR